MWLCHAGLIATGRQVIAALTMMLALAVFVPFLSTKGGASSLSFVASFWRSAFAYLAIVRFCRLRDALTSGKPIDTAADRIARRVATAKKWHSKPSSYGIVGPVCTWLVQWRSSKSPPRWRLFTRAAHGKCAYVRLWPKAAVRRRAEHVRSARVVQTSTCSAIASASSTSIPRYRTVLSIFL